ncbi:Tetraspanin-7-like [Oopsacas minuta]|uniref:Tetraspanin-7-like n=1 Tax=Oopsacas minuta TaxID=111878 RepID=A0AAV7K991_9METZ|nr:Tetraspanin-7-like [Oopsacas minuta]
MLAVGSYLTVFDAANRNILETFQLPSPVNGHHFKVLYITTLISGVLLFIACITNVLGAFVASFSPRNNTKLISIALLGATIYILLLATVIQLTGGSYGNAISIELSYENYVKDYSGIFHKRYFTDRQRINQSSIDKLHQVLKCCGPEGPDSYENMSNIPSSCCKVFYNATECDTADFMQIYNEGCLERTYVSMLLYVYEFFKLIALGVLSTTILYLVAVVTAGMLLFVLMVEKRR